MAQDQLLPARQAQLAILRDAYRNSADTGQLVTVSGPAGIGRTTLLAQFARELRTKQVLVLTATATAATGDNVDPFGLDLLIASLRADFEQFGDARVAGLIGALSEARTMAAGSGSAWNPRIAVGLGATFGHLGRLRRIALLVDDVQLIPEPAMALAAARRPGCLVVAAHADLAEPTPGSRELLALADLTVPLPSVPDNEIATLVTRTLGLPLDDGALAALRTALGPLSGHPGTVLSTLDILATDDRLATVHDRLCLRAPIAAIALPADHELCRRANDLGAIGRRVLASVSVFDSIAIDDLPRLADLVGAGLTECGQAVDRLIGRGVLLIDARARLRCRCAALAAAALSFPGKARGLPVDAADALLRLLDEHAPVDDPGAPSRSGRVDWLVTKAQASTTAEPEHAVRYYLAALRSSEPSAAEPVLRALLPLLIRTGQTEQLAELVEKAAIELPSSAELHAELVLAARFSTVHTGRLLAEPAMRALFAAPPSDCAAWWFTEDTDDATPNVAGAGLPSAAEIRLIRAAARGDRAACRQWYLSAGIPNPAGFEQLLTAGELGDLATICQLVLGARYRAPETGLLAAHQRVVRGYADGDWSAALSAARAIALIEPAETIVAELAGLLAAEICGARGHLDSAGRWLADRPTDHRIAALHGWVDAGLRAQTADPGDAADWCWQTYLRLRDSGSHRGIESLLIRATELATAAAALDIIASAAREIDTWEQHPDPGLRRIGAAALVRAAAFRDARAAGTAVDIAVQRGQLPDQFIALLMAARIVDDPAPYLERAQRIALRCACPIFEERVRMVSWERGVSAPQRERQTLSAVEVRIVDLISAGLTNRQIGSALALSEKAVENQLTRLFALTGCRSRMELATAWVEGRLELAS